MIHLHHILILFSISLCLGRESPKVNPFSPFIKPVIGGKTSFTCQSLFGSPPFQMIWYKDGKQINQDSTIKIRTNEDLSTLIIDSIKSSHSGNYTCSISNSYGSDSYTSQLLVEGSPNWIEKPMDIKSNFGGAIKIQCLASAYPVPKISWEKQQGFSWIPIVDNFLHSTRISFSGNNLSIVSVTREDGGKYRCVVSNGIKPDLISEFDITIDGNLIYIGEGLV